MEDKTMEANRKKQRGSGPGLPRKRNRINQCNAPQIEEVPLMKNTTKMTDRIISILLCVALLVSYLPMVTLRSYAADAVTGSASIIADAGTAHTWETMMGTAADGNRYAGRVWADKSVFTDGQTALLNTSGTAGSSFQVALENDEAFQIIFSALGSSMTTTTTNTYMGPLDVVMVFDTSTSMRYTVEGKTRLQHTIEAANLLIQDLLKVSNVRIGVVTYNNDSEVVLPLDFYTNGVTLDVNDYENTNGGGVVSARDDDNNLLGSDDGFTQGTNLQAGIDSCFRMLATASNATGRTPVALIMTDGEANRAVRNNWYNVPNGTVSSSSTTGIALSTLLNASFGRAWVENHYGRAPIVYGVGADLSNSGLGPALMNPGASNGFNNNNSSSSVRSAYNLFLDWADGETVTSGNGNSRYTFDHNLPAASGVTTADVVANINYVDDYFRVTSDKLSVTFTQIYEELISGAFNPISSSQTVAGGTGVENTPLVYVDRIGHHMEIKRIQSITLFGASYTVIRNADGTYTVTEAAGVNPTTNENYNTAENIRISVTENADGTQTLRVEIDQQILPIILEQIQSDTNNGVTNATITEMTYAPLRVFYTVGLDADIFLPTGEIDVSKLADNYPYINDATGEISFYSNQFGSVEKIDGEGNPYTERLDTHIGFKPSPANRYYYHQANQGIYTSVTAKDGSTVNWEADEYGVLYEENKYNFNYLTYEAYSNLSDEDTVYTYVTYYRPTSETTDAANAAEDVTYIVYTQWGYLKESVAFYDRNTGEYVNYDEVAQYVTGSKGYAIPEEQVEATISAYLAANPNADLVAMLGVGSLRTSRLHNMMVAKETNATGTAEIRYEPQYTYATAADHSDNDVVIWLGNNGKLTTTIATGIALTKAVTEAIGNADDTYALTVTVPSNVTAAPVVKDANGNDVTAAISTYSNHILTVNLKAGETVYISGIPAGTECAIGEVIDGDYYIESQTASVIIPTLSQVLAGTAQYVPATVTNAPYKYGNLYITKEMTSDHAIPNSVMAEAFNLVVNVGAVLAGQSFTVKKGNLDNPGSETVTTETVDAAGNLNLTIQARQTIEILDLPEGIEVSITEELTDAQAQIFATTYRTRNHSGEEADADGRVTIPAGANATAVITNKYTPQATSVDLDIAGTKIFEAEENANLNGGSFTFLVQQWNGSAWVDMTSAVTTYAAGESGTKTFLIENVLQGITYTHTGSWAYQVLEVKGSLENLTYDRTLYTFTVTVTDNGGQLVAAVTDLNNTPITDGSYEVTFTNTYHTAPVSIDVSKEVVNNSGDDTVSKAGFAFSAVQTDENWNALAGGAVLTVYSDAAGEARFTATYTDAGTYYYLVSEIAGSGNGWSYSNAQYHVTVTVTEDNGNLISTMTIEAVAGTTVTGEQATVTGNNGTISFVNTYDPEDVTVELDAAVKKNLTGKTLTAGAFTFYVYDNGTTNTVLTGTNDADGNVAFDGVLSFDKAGKYEYDIVESRPAEAVYDSATGRYILHGMAYDATVYDLVVEVENNSQTGKLEATYYFEDSTTNTVTFRNVYTATPTAYTFSGTKHLHGRAMAAGEFSFQLYEGETLLETVTNKADGSFSFSAITYTTAGTHTYTIREVAGSAPGVVYTGASNPITVTVTVTDTNGVLSAAADVANANIQFENTYTANAATVTFDGSKTLAGALLADNTFTFKLYQTDSAFDLTKATLVDQDVNVSGCYAFETLTFTQPGTFFYAIVEDASVNPQADVVYDSTVHQFRVRVSDLGNGQLMVEVQNLNTGSTTQAAAAVTISAGFTNATFQEVTEKEVYLAGNTTTQIDGQKVNAGEILTYYITYTNYTGKAVTADISDTIPNHTSYVDGSASHSGTFVGNRVNWIIHVAKGESVTVSFQVKVDETDIVVANTAIIRDGVNTYTTNQVTNHTFEDVVEKDVFKANDTTVSINGENVAAGDTLVYTVRYTNLSTENVSVTITDRIPAHTVYIMGSADNGGVYADGKLTWTLDVPAWATVTVSFQVSVSATESVIIQNQAEIAEGSNHYATNVVNNPFVPDTTGFTINKVWNDANDQDGIRPQSITVNVYGNGTLVTTVQLTAANNWTYTLTALDKYENGTEIVYTVEEAAVTGYTGVVTGSVQESFVITNTHETEKTHISVSKVWDDQDNQDGKRPASIIVHLLADGVQTGNSVTLSAANHWTYSWSELDKYADGVAINYTVYEEPVAEYTTTYDPDPSNANHVIITNAYKPGETSFTVQKVWEDNHNQDGIRPGSVIVKLLANGADTGLTAELNESNNWKYTFAGLDLMASGVSIVYTAEEVNVPNGYTVSYQPDAETGIYEVINTHVPETVDVTVNKVWMDNNDQDGIRPDSVVLELVADGAATGKTVTVNASGNWSGTFTGMAKYHNGTLVTYAVREVNVPDGYTVSYAGTTATNTHITDTISITVSKVWVDNNNQDGIRPNAIIVNLYANGEFHSALEANASNLGVVTFQNLPKYADGVEIIYTVAEDSVPAGYTASYSGDAANGFVITNTHEVAKTEISVSKVWDDQDNQDGKRPASIVVHLLVNGDHTGKTLTLSAANSWSGKWSDLDEYHNGTKINYTVYEEEVAGYTAEYMRDTANNNHVIITNAYAPEKTSVTVQKVWVDNDNQDGLRPVSVEVELYANNQPTGQKGYLGAGNSWKFSFTNLDAYADGMKIAYTVVELTKVNGYEVSYKTDELTGIYEIINTHQVEKISIPVKKDWNDNNNQDGIRPGSVTVELFADGATTGKTLVLSAANGWSGSFDDMDQYANGIAVVYTVREVNTPAGYTVSITGNASTGFTLTNSHTPDQTQITINKVWNDANDQDGIRPQSITVNVYGNGTLVTTVQLTAATGWTYTLTGLPKYDGGNEIVYTISETAVEGYTTTVNGLTITNTHVPETTQMSVSKVWDDDNNRDGIRPNSVIVHLLVDGNHTGLQVTLSAANGWTYTWTDLAKYADGVAINYTVYETPVENYTPTYVRDSGDPSHVIITNAYAPQKTSFGVLKVWDDDHNRDGLRTQVEVELYANGQPTGITVFLREGNNWYHVFADLNKMENGSPIEYTAVERTKIGGYTVSYKLDSETGIYEIINTHQPETTQITVDKIWNDANDQDGIRPEQLSVALFANGIYTGKTAILSSANGWSYTFTDLHMNANGKPIVYTVEEYSNLGLEGYVGTIQYVNANKIMITNTHIPEVTDIPVNKIWDDNNNQDGIRPNSVTVALIANGVDTGLRVELNAANGWQAVFTGVAVNSNGSPIVYTLQELNVAAGYTDSYDGFTVINTHEPETTIITVYKKWDDADNKDGLRPDSVEVHLLANGEHTGQIRYLRAEDKWISLWVDLPVYSNGVPIVYTVWEKPVDGYTTEYNRIANTVNITNTHIPEVTEVTVSKVWEDNHNQDGLRPGSIIVNLYANGVFHSALEANVENQFAVTFQNLPKYENGRPIIYTVEEASVPAGYTASYSGSAANGFVITNTYAPEKTSVTVSKVWQDNDNQDGKRPASITIHLLANGEQVASQVITAEMGWTYTFAELARYADGKEIVYTITEDAVEGYTTVIDGYTVTNRYEPEKTTVTVSKVWQDNDNQDGKRPASITIHLLANGEQVASQVITAEMGWTYTFAELARYADGKEIVYTITEDAVEGYTTVIDGFTVINRYEPEKTTVTVNKVWVDNDDAHSKRPAYVQVVLLANGEQVGEVVLLSESNNWSHIWTDLYLYADGGTIVYTVEEWNVAEGYTVSYSNDGLNFQITNTLEEIPDGPPPTGDNIQLVVMLMMVSMVSVLLMTVRKKSRDE